MLLANVPLGRRMNFLQLEVPRITRALLASDATVDDSDEDVQQYAMLIVVTNTPVERALVYLEDCRSARSAHGRLLLRAAERSFRERGDSNGPNYKD